MRTYNLSVPKEAIEGMLLLANGHIEQLENEMALAQLSTRREELESELRLYLELAKSFQLKVEDFEVEEEADLSPREFGEAVGFEYEAGEKARLKDIVEPILNWRDSSIEHDQCAVYCGNCGEIRADAICKHCSGSGANVAASTASGAWSECEWCAGAGKIHENCE